MHISLLWFIDKIEHLEKRNSTSTIYGSHSSEGNITKQIYSFLLCYFICLNSPFSFHTNDILYRETNCPRREEFNQQSH